MKNLIFVDDIDKNMRMLWKNVLFYGVVFILFVLLAAWINSYSGPTEAEIGKRQSQEQDAKNAAIDARNP